MTQEEFNTVSTKKKIPDVSRRTNIQTFVFLFLLISCFNSLSQRWQSYWWKLMCNFKILYYQCEWVIPWWLCEFIYIRFWKFFFFSEIILCMWVSSAMCLHCYCARTCMNGFLWLWQLKCLNEITGYKSET